MTLPEMIGTRRASSVPWDDVLSEPGWRIFNRWYDVPVLKICEMEVVSWQKTSRRVVKCTTLSRGKGPIPLEILPVSEERGLFSILPWKGYLLYRYIGVWGFKGICLYTLNISIQRSHRASCLSSENRIIEHQMILTINVSVALNNTSHQLQMSAHNDSKFSLYTIRTLNRSPRILDPIFIPRLRGIVYDKHYRLSLIHIQMCIRDILYLVLIPLSSYYQFTCIKCCAAKC